MLIIENITLFVHLGSSSDSDELSISDEDEADGTEIPACTPLASFLSFKQEAEKKRTSQNQLETTAKVVSLHKGYVKLRSKSAQFQIGHQANICVHASVLARLQTLPWWL